jgi:hypothetical protein
MPLGSAVYLLHQQSVVCDLLHEVPYRVLLDGPFQAQESPLVAPCQMRAAEHVGINVSNFDCSFLPVPNNSIRPSVK